MYSWLNQNNSTSFFQFLLNWPFWDNEITTRISGTNRSNLTDLELGTIRDETGGFL
jgi:hypothetical protein